jgi:SAM-dependent methyltransferase
LEPELFDEMVSLERTHWWLAGRRELLGALVAAECARRREPIRRWVDVGVGTGALLQDVGSLVEEPIGVESDAVPLDIARRRGLNVVEATAERLPFDDGSVDLVTAFDVIEHVDDDRGAVAEFVRVLAPAGTAIVTVPAYNWLWSGHDTVHGHRRRYTSSSLTRVLEAGGLRLRDAGYFNTLMFPPAAAVRLVQKVRPRQPTSDLKPVAEPVNTVLLRLFRLERPAVLRGGFPFGLSVLAIGDRPPPG